MSGMVSHGQYDITRDREVGTRFVLSIISIMVFMGVLAFALCIVLQNISSGWTHDFKGVITIEIPAHTAGDTDQGAVRTIPQLSAIRTQMLQSLESIDGIADIRAIPFDDIRAELVPWLGGAAEFSSLPIPALIHLRMDSPDQTIAPIEQAVYAIIDDAVINRHESWLSDLSRLTQSISLMALGLLILIAATVSFAISGAVRARLSAHAEEVDLLHLMGAQDGFIVRQFRSHIFNLVSQACVIGTICGVMTVIGLGFLAGTLDLALSDLPGFLWWQWPLLGVVPLCVLILSALVARKTILSVLTKMP